MEIEIVENERLLSNLVRLFTLFILVLNAIFSVASFLRDALMCMHNAIGHALLSHQTVNNCKTGSCSFGFDKLLDWFQCILLPESWIFNIVSSWGTFLI